MVSAPFPTAKGGTCPRAHPQTDEQNGACRQGGRVWPGSSEAQTPAAGWMSPEDAVPSKGCWTRKAGQGGRGHAPVKCPKQESPETEADWQWPGAVRGGDRDRR